MVSVSTQAQLLVRNDLLRALQGADMEAALRMPVLAALGQLRIDPAVAEKVLRAALEVRAREAASFQQFPAQCMAAAVATVHRVQSVNAPAQ